MAAPTDPEALVHAARAGDQRAWDAIIDRFGRLVYSIPRRYGLNDADADDVFQSVFVTLFQHLDRLRDAERLSSWLITTTHRTCWRIGRRSGRNPGLDAVMPDLGAPDDVDASQWERQDLVRHGLELLGGRCERLLTLLFAEEADYQAVAAALDMPMGSIGPTRARCFSKLERILTDLGFEPDVVKG